MPNYAMLEKVIRAKWLSRPRFPYENNLATPLFFFAIFHDFSQTPLQPIVDIISSLAYNQQKNQSTTSTIFVHRSVTYILRILGKAKLSTDSIFYERVVNYEIEESNQSTLIRHLFLFA